MRRCGQVGPAHSALKAATGRRRRTRSAPSARPIWIVAITASTASRDVGKGADGGGDRLGLAAQAQRQLGDQAQRSLGADEERRSGRSRPRTCAPGCRCGSPGRRPARPRAPARCRASCRSAPPWCPRRGSRPCRRAWRWRPGSTGKNRPVARSSVVQRLARHAGLHAAVHVLGVDLEHPVHAARSPPTTPPRTASACPSSEVPAPQPDDRAGHAAAQICTICAPPPRWSRDRRRRRAGVRAKWASERPCASQIGLGPCSAHRLRRLRVRPVRSRWSWGGGSCQGRCAGTLGAWRGGAAKDGADRARAGMAPRGARQS